MHELLRSRKRSAAAGRISPYVENNSHDSYKSAWVRRIQRLPAYPIILKSIVAGHNVSTIARWCHDANPKGDLHDKSVETWRKYLTALSKVVKSKLKRVERIDIKPIVFDGVIRQLLEQQHLASARVVSNSDERILKSLNRAVRQIESEVLLKYCLAIQKLRVDRLVELERQMGFLLPRGHKEIDTLRQLASSLVDLEQGIRCDIAKNRLVHWSPKPR